MAMSSIPPQTRSLRKPALGIGQYDQSMAATVTAADTSSRERVLKRRGDESPVRSPSRLPQPPSTSSAIVRPPRPLSISSNPNASTMPPPGRTAGVSRPPITLDNKTSSVRSGTRTPTEPNTARSIVSRPPLTSNNKTSQIRSGARTPTESNSSSQRRPSSKASVSRPHLTSENKNSIPRSGARTPTEPNTSLQRRPSVPSRGHNRNASAVSLASSVRASSNAAHTRAASTISAFSSTTTNHARTASTVSATTAGTILRPPSQQSHPQSPTQQSFPNSAVSRPAFSTLQQHFSPLKSVAPKPSTSSYLVPPSPSKLPSNQLISAETARLQAELLQLHLLHQSAPYSLRVFRSTGKAKLEKRFESLREAHEELAQKERETQGRRNVMALQQWDGGGVGWSFDDKMQTLDVVLAALWNLSEPGGRYARVVRKFERWITEVEEILENRRLEGASEGQVRFVEKMEKSWKDECEALSRKLEPCKGQLRQLGELDGEGSLSIVVKSLNTLMKGTQQELAIMRAIEMDVSKKEEDWIREVLENGDSDADEAETPGAVWRRY